MRVIADFHIHGKYSRATSTRMEINEISRFAAIKGLHLVGTGDFTHPKWFEELSKNLVEDEGRCLYVPRNESLRKRCKVKYMISGEVSTVFEHNNFIKKIHHVIFTPSLETAVQICDRLNRYGDLSADGRPTLKMTASELVEEVMEVSRYNMVIPAHAWTPWFSLFGAFSGFDRIEDCYQDATKYISAIETGLSSDPPMNWRISALDRFALISNSDSHSPWPWRIGREANVFELRRFTYWEIINAIRKRDPKVLLFTIETNPAYGKYHWTGHRDCKVSLPPKEAIKLGNVCPICHKFLTKGVEQRVEELADRPSGYKPPNAPGYIHLLPLSEIISTVIGASSPNRRRVWKIYNALISRFGNEYSVLLDASFKEMAEVSDPEIAKAITQVRDSQIVVIPGYDGVYGRLVFGQAHEKGKDTVNNRKFTFSSLSFKSKASKQKSLADFI